jgi:hypothetical protein
MTALNQAYASNSETPILTVEFSHPALDLGGVDPGFYRIAASNTDLSADIEDSSTKLFKGYRIDLSLPPRDTEGSSNVNITVSNVNNLFWDHFKPVRAYNVTTPTPVQCVIRSYLPSDLTAPAETATDLYVVGVTLNTQLAIINAAYDKLYNSFFPRYKYYPTEYAGVKYL